MPNEYYSIITNNGLIKEAQAGQIGGSPINLTEIAVGDGGGSHYEPSADATSLVNELYRANLTSSVLDANNPNQLIIEGVIPEEAGPFDIREVGIFDDDGDLFAIGKYPLTFKSNYESGSGKRLYIRMIIGFVSTPNVEIMISENINFDPNFEANLNDELDNRLKISENLAELDNVATARSNLGLEIDVDIQAFSSNLDAFANISGEQNKIPYFTNPAEFALIDKGYQLKNIQIFTASGTWTKSAGINAIIVEVQGGGGAGRGGGLNSYACGGGGAGGYAKSLITNPSASENITIGGGGNGGPGGTSSFGSILSATGGNYGNIWYGAAGGQGIGGNIVNLKGSGGTNSMPRGATGDSGGSGGSSKFNGNGIGNAGGGLASGDISAKANSGSGGGGGSWTSNGTPAGTGGSGIVIIYEYV
jgi:hypothetical protein